MPKNEIILEAAIAVGHVGSPLSILDGIFVAIKDDIDCLPHPSKGKSTVFLFQNISLEVVCIA